MIVLKRLSKVRWNKLLIVDKYLICMGFTVENWYFCCSLLPSKCLITVIMVQSIKSSSIWGDMMSILNLLLQLFATFDDIYLLVCFCFRSLLKVKTVGYKWIKDRLLSVWKQLLWVGFFLIGVRQRPTVTFVCLEECKVKENVGNLMFVLTLQLWVILFLCSSECTVSLNLNSQLALWLLGIKELGNSLKVKLIRFLRGSVQVLVDTAFKTTLSKPS